MQALLPTIMSSFLCPTAVATLPLHAHLLNVQATWGQQMTAEKHEFCPLSKLVHDLFTRISLNTILSITYVG